MLENNNYINLRDYVDLIIPTGLLVIFCCLCLLIRFNKQLRKKNRVLNEINHVFKLSIADKDLQLKEIHHRIKNNLQLIVSLLNIEASNSKQATVDDFLLKGQSRIHSISLIHQNLYETESCNAINLQNYIENITQNLSQIYSTNIKIKINTNETTLDVETAIPIGLIITELVCNAFKHAKSDHIKIDIIKSAENKLELILKDNGIGFPEKPISKLGIGLELVEMMVLQIDGKLNRKNQQGTVYNISF